MQHKTLITACLVIMYSISFSQNWNGYYTFHLPTEEIFGKGYSKLSNKNINDPSNIGASFICKAEYLEISNSAETIYDSVQTYTEQDILSKSFQSSKNINIHVSMLNPKKVTLKPAAWSNIRSGFNYVYEAIRADSIEITGGIHTQNADSSKVLQELISKFISDKTLGGIFLKVANIYNRQKVRNDTFDILIKDTSVYFAAKFINTNVNFNRENQPLCGNDIKYQGRSRRFDFTSMKDTFQFPLLDGDSTSLLVNAPYSLGDYYPSGCEIVNGSNPFVVYMRFIYDKENKKGHVKIFKREKSGTEMTLINIETKDVLQTPVPFENTFIQYFPSSQASNDREKGWMYFFEYNLIFDPTTRKVTVYNYINREIQTDVYGVYAKIKFFPSLN